jgi:hypothetical protein
MTQKIFSIPLNPKLNEQQYIEFVNFVNDYKDYIKDVYFTTRIAPFNQDAMGDVFVHEDSNDVAIEQALFVQTHTGVPVSATFNNIQVPPTQKNLDTFIKNFKPLYDKGVRTATIPHTHWMATGQIQKAFPELYVKNTILRDVRVAAEIVNLAKRGFNYINLDRDLMRDTDTLKRLVEAKTWIKKNLGKDIHYSLLANEGCLGNCPMMVEHFEYNNAREDSDPQYFYNPISRVSCPKWDVDDPSVHLKTANIPPWREDWQEFLDNLGIDVFKMHGREAISRLYETMDIVKRWANGDEILYDNFNNYLEANNLQEKPINAWRKKIRNCKFDCWECHFCDDIYKIKSKIVHTDLVKHTSDSIIKSGIPTVKIDVPGLTSSRVQTVLNNIAQGVETYMEVGTAQGATFFGAIKDNNLHAIAIDKWHENIQPQELGREKLPTNDRVSFIENAKRFKGDNKIDVINKDIFSVNLSTYKDKVNMWFYDGPHDALSTARAVEYYASSFSQEAVLIFDDANWDGVVEGARKGINAIGAEVGYEKLLLCDVEDSNSWWNGLYIVVINKVEKKDTIEEEVVIEI